MVQGGTRAWLMAGSGGVKLDSYVKFVQMCLGVLIMALICVCVAGSFIQQQCLRRVCDVMYE